MYEHFFGFTAPPFRITPDTAFFYSGGERKALITAIAYAISHGDGIIKVVGEVGGGKTMLSRMLARELPDSIKLVYLLNPSLQASDLVFAIGRDLGLEFDAACSKNNALQAVQHKLLDMHAQHQRVVVFIDEAQCMPLETLEELRLLSNLETETDKLLQVVLFGQPELDEHLAHRSVRQIKERIIHNFYLQAFTRPEVEEYISFRLHKAGYNGLPLFSKAALKRISHYSSGLPRKLSILADKSLLAAFSSQSKTIEVQHVQRAAQDFGYTKIGAFRSSLLVAVVAVLALFVTYYMLAYPQGRPVLKAGGGVLVLPATSEKVVDKAVVTNPLSVPSGPLSITHGVTVKAAAELREPTLDALDKKTQAWMKTSTGAVYTIQILSTNIDNKDFLDNFFLNIAKDIGLAELYVYPVRLDEKTLYAVTLGGFAGLEKATAYLDSLPAFLQRYQPYIKNIASFNTGNE